MSRNTKTPLFPPLQQRAAGVFCHLTSLPSTVGIGTLGAPAKEFLHFLNSAGMSLWQVCPIGPTGFGDSPYQTFSTHAGNPYLLDWEYFRQQGWVSEQDFQSLQCSSPNKVDFGHWYQTFWPIWYRTAKAFIQSPHDLWGDYQHFVQTEQSWLLPYATFAALKQRFGGISWTEWPASYRQYPLPNHVHLTAEDSAIVEFYQISQFFFFRQWAELRAQAQQAGVSLIGDVPFYVALDSADVWANQSLFKLYKSGQPTHVAGVPPDYFSPDGQRWGNPIYRWDVMAKDGYHWWTHRLQQQFRLFDVLRLDHFRGFASFWSVPAANKTARYGKWCKGPAIDLVQHWAKCFAPQSLIAEDLGLMTKDVELLLQQTGLPRMAVLQFAFDGDSDNMYLPHNHTHNMVLYSGTHDNDTTNGWYDTASEKERDQFRRYLRVSGETPSWDAIRTCMQSVARWFIIPMQDILGLGASARFNTPGTTLGNWSWRMTSQQLSHCLQESAPYLKDLLVTYGRNPQNKPEPTQDAASIS
jgi:4-alpha-glucanotransferase